MPDFAYTIRNFIDNARATQINGRTAAIGLTVLVVLVVGTWFLFSASSHGRPSRDQLAEEGARQGAIFEKWNADKAAARAKEQQNRQRQQPQRQPGNTGWRQK